VASFLRQAHDLEIVEIADGYVVYHHDRDRVHYFNHTAALVLALVDGTKSVDEVTRLIQLAYELPEPPADEVAACFTQLQDEGLVV
jgi:hypothetical protein